MSSPTAPTPTPADVQLDLAVELGQAAALRQFARQDPEGRKYANLIENEVLTPVHKVLLAGLEDG